MLGLWEAHLHTSCYRGRPHPGGDNVLSDKQTVSSLSAWSSASVWLPLSQGAVYSAWKSQNRTDRLNGPLISPVLSQEFRGSKSFINIR